MMRTAVLALAVVLIFFVTAAADFQVPPYEPLAVEARVPAYQVKPDLSNIANLKQFGALTESQKALLAKNAFFVAPADDQQLYFIYENNDYLVIPSFVASDAVLQLYHIFYDYSLREMEAERLIPLAKQLTTHMLEQSLSMYRSLPPGAVRTATLENVAYFGVASDLLGLSPDLPPAAEDMVGKELTTIGAHQGRETSAIFGYKFDYSQFVPRGHYTRSDELKRYFKAMVWYGLVPFALELPPPRKPEVCYGQIRQSLLITRLLYTTDLDGHLPEPEELTDTRKLDAFHDVAMAIRGPRIATFPGKSGPREQILDIPTGPQFRFMGQRDIPDSYIFQQLVWSNVGTLEYNRRRPLGLDVFAVLGSSRAFHHLDGLGEREFAHYDEQMEKLRAEFGAKTEEEWRQNLYWGWLWVLKGLAEPPTAGFPSFMRTDAWLDKELNTALASWAEMRHDTILYAKQSVTAECGDGGPEEEPPTPKGYVEPVPDIYHRLLWLTQATRKGLRDRDLLTGSLDDSFDRMEDLLVFLERVSLKELADQPLTAAEYDQIRLLGSQIEYITNQLSSAVSEEYGYLISDADEDMAVVADVHTDHYYQKCLEEGVGHAGHIYVVVPVGGKLCLTRGSVFSYYEFVQPLNDRLTDEAWQKMLEAGEAPPPPEWTSSFRADGKPEVPVPDVTRSVMHWGSC